MKDSKQNETPLKEKKQYVKPVLIPLGDIRDVTMGGSVGIGDSGMENSGFNP